MKSWSVCTRSAITVLALLAAAGSAQAQNVVISQVYGGGGNSGATLTNDFIELFNPGAVAVDLTGWSVQYASSGGSFSSNITVLSGSIPAGGYYLIQQAQGAGGSQPLPTPDAIGTIAMAGASGKVALVNNSTALSGSCPLASVVDFVGYGAANCFEGAGATGVLNNTTAAIRLNDGCQDTNSNTADFAVGTPNPRNSASPTTTCGTGTAPTGTGGATPTEQCPGFDVVLTVQVTPGANPTSTGITVTADTTDLGGFPGLQMFDNGVSPDATAGDGIYSASATIQSFVTPGLRNVPIEINDAQGRTGLASAPVTILNCNPQAFGTATPAGVCNGGTTLFTVEVTPGIQPDSTGIEVTVDLSELGGSFTQQLFDDGTNGDVTAGDNIYSLSYTFAASATPGFRDLPVFVIDDQFRTDSAIIPVANGDCTPSDSTVVISQVYGGGGNSGSTLTNDFIELFNRSNSPVDITGWSVQYASATSTDGFTQKTDLVGTIPAGGYYLIQQSQGAGGTQPLPTPDAVGTIFLSSTGARIALVRDGTLIGADCEASTVADLVAYGSNAACFEGVAPAPGTTNPFGVMRAEGGCQDFDNNSLDFARVEPMPRNSASPLNPCAGGPTCPPCAADFDQSGGVDGDDIAAFFNDWQAGAECGDVDGSGGVDGDDIPFFFIRWEAGGC